MYATKSYENPHMGVDEFNEDIKSLSYIKRLLRKYENSYDGEKIHHQVRLLLNHIITINNQFSSISSIRIIFFYCDTYSYPALKSIFSYLDILPESIPEVNLDMIKYDERMINILENI